MSSNLNPKVSVVMPVYNAALYLRDAIESILAQTFGDFEFIIIDDCSTDDSYAIAQSYDDPRIALYRNDQNCGVTRTLNRGLELACGEYIARMDADDISLPHRINKQLDYLRANPETDFLGTNMSFMDSKGNHLSGVALDTTSNPGGIYLKWLLLWGNNYLAHPTMLFRCSSLVENRLKYDETYTASQDYDLWTRAARVCTMATIPDVCLVYRKHPDSVSATKKDKQKSIIRDIIARELKLLLAREVDMEAVEILAMQYIPPRIENPASYVSASKLLVDAYQAFVAQNSLSAEDEARVRSHAVGMLRKIVRYATPYSQLAALRSLWMIRHISAQSLLTVRTVKDLVKVGLVTNSLDFV